MSSLLGLFWTYRNSGEARLLFDGVHMTRPFTWRVYPEEYIWLCNSNFSTIQIFLLCEHRFESKEASSTFRIHELWHKLLAVGLDFEGIKALTLIYTHIRHIAMKKVIFCLYVLWVNLQVNDVINVYALYFVGYFQCCESCTLRWRTRPISRLCRKRCLSVGQLIFGSWRLTI